MSATITTDNLQYTLEGVFKDDAGNTYPLASDEQLRLYGLPKRLCHCERYTCVIVSDKVYPVAVLRNPGIVQAINEIRNPPDAPIEDP